MCGRCMYLHPTVVNEGGSSSQQPSEASSLCRHRGWGKPLLRKQKAREEKSDKKGERAWNLLQACEMQLGVRGRAKLTWLPYILSPARPYPGKHKRTCLRPQSINQRRRHELLPKSTLDIHPSTDRVLATWLDCIENIASYYIAASTSTLHHSTTQCRLPPKQSRTSLNRKKSVC
jgi:hypothetical protein